MVQMISESKRKIAALALAGAMAIGGAAGVATTIASPAQNQSGIVMEAEAATKGYHLYSQKFLSKEGLYYQQTKKFTFPKTYTVSKTNAQKWYGLNKAITMTRKSITRADNNDGKTVTNPAVIGVRGDGGTSITFTGNRNTTSDGYATFKFEVVYTYTEGNTTYQLTKHYNQVLYSSKLYYKFSKASLTIAKNGSASVAISPQTAGGHAIDSTVDCSITGYNSSLVTVSKSDNTVTVTAKKDQTGSTKIQMKDSYGSRTCNITIK